MDTHFRHYARRRSRMMHRHVKREAAPQATRTVFATPEATGKGRIIGFSTMAPEEVDPEPTEESSPDVFEDEDQDQDQDEDDTFVFESTPTRTKTSSRKATPTSTLKSPKSPSSTASKSVSLATAKSTTASSTRTTPTAQSVTASPTASQTSTAEASKGGLSTGAAAGLVGAGVAAVIILAFIGFLVYRKKAQRKQEAYGKPEDEKTVGDTGVAAFTEKRAPSPVNTITSEKAPRVSLRPVTQFLPNLSVNQANNQTNQNGGLQPGPITQPAVQQAPQQESQAAAPLPTSSMAGSEARRAPPPALVLTPEDESKNGSNSMDKPPVIPAAQLSPTPSGYTEYTPSLPGTPTSVTAPAGGPGGPPSQVHRVQMDFVPSMNDELALRAGQLVRIIHEYDDGWALCIRLDRSQQGVCPRTCLSQRPVKPRPHGPPGSPAGRRPGPPQGPPQGRPGPGPNGPARSPSPAPQHRPPHHDGRASPNGGPASPRPQSPGGVYNKPQYRPSGHSSRPQSPVGSPTGQQPRPQSPSSAPRPAVAPVRPSPLSNQTSSTEEPKAETSQQSQVVFHAM